MKGFVATETSQADEEENISWFYVDFTCAEER